ncbi:MAG: hypothetical protein IOD15_04400 [Phycisphaerales bacterium]|jgi:hypothetical protein|nr:hypothetical protein [Phycisphaerales bacterium]
MAEWLVSGADRTSGKDRTIRLTAASREEAMQAGIAKGLMVAGLEELHDAPPASPATWRPGSALARAGLVLNIAGLALGPLAAAGCVLGALAQERSEGAIGGGVQTAGAVITLLSAVLWAVAGFVIIR